MTDTLEHFSYIDEKTGMTMYGYGPDTGNSSFASGPEAPTEEELVREKNYAKLTYFKRVVGDLERELGLHTIRIDVLDGALVAHDRDVYVHEEGDLSAYRLINLVTKYMLEASK